MTRDQIFNKIADLVSQQFNISRDKITENLNFKSDLEADSIDFVEFMLDLEDEFDAEIPDDKAEGIDTIGQAVDYVISYSKDIK